MNVPTTAWSHQCQSNDYQQQFVYIVRRQTIDFAREFQHVEIVRFADRDRELT